MDGVGWGHLDGVKSAMNQEVEAIVFGNGVSFRWTNDPTVAHVASFCCKWVDRHAMLYCVSDRLVDVYCGGRRIRRFRTVCVYHRQNVTILATSSISA